MAAEIGRWVETMERRTTGEADSGHRQLRQARGGLGLPDRMNEGQPAEWSYGEALIIGAPCPMAPDWILDAGRVRARRVAPSFAFRQGEPCLPKLRPSPFLD